MSKDSRHVRRPEREHPFRELDDLVLRLKGLVLVRKLRRRANADAEELGLYSAEIARIGERLAQLTRDGGALRASRAGPGAGYALAAADDASRAYRQRSRIEQ